MLTATRASYLMAGSWRPASSNGGGDELGSSSSPSGVYRRACVVDGNDPHSHGESPDRDRISLKDVVGQLGNYASQ
eukprot:8272827-Pyramimonas_sp.AAC.1